MHTAKSLVKIKKVLLEFLREGSRYFLALIGECVYHPAWAGVQEKFSFTKEDKKIFILLYEGTLILLDRIVGRRSFFARPAHSCTLLHPPAYFCSTLG